ncbi:F0F1 ATP synthase subunit A [Natranaerofaba carboxydovora]|uniref:F0F1 ATP synthase subunit A n=1 Tax=Natranaerofaba carboxydovora TaxID=2742683 RepID=UPI001F1432AF|nr:F0F1 ATP synthase subunit A [Natranaerofaba carboxydovora]UMZ75111.1 ATP synthase subunit a [Natranaerofaba carboxydovora]
MENGTDFDPAVMFEVAGYQITETVTTTWVIMVILVVLAILTTRQLQKVPETNFQNIMELVYEGVEWLVDSTMGKENRSYLPYVGTITLYILIANLTGLIGVRQPTADLNTTFSLAFITFILIHASGIKSKGVGGYMRGFLEPLPFLLPLNIISELAQPFSLAFRLFGNMLGAIIIMYLLYSFAPIIIPVVPHMYFDIFAGVIQTFIFVMLTMTYISIAME